MEKICKNCKWWDGYKEDGECKKITHEYGSNNNTFIDMGNVYLDAFGEIWLNTNFDFGCNFFETKGE